MRIARLAISELDFPQACFSFRAILRKSSATCRGCAARSASPSIETSGHRLSRQSAATGFDRAVTYLTAQPRPACATLAVDIHSNHHRNFAPARRHALDADDRSVNYQQRVIEVVHRRADVSRNKIKIIAHGRNLDAVRRVNRQMLFARLLRL